VIPSLRDWHERYREKGLVVIGIHYPEFEYEKDLDNLMDAIERLDVSYAVAQDNQRQAWSSYGVRYWPTLVLIDKDGRVRYQHIGEGRYDKTEAAIQLLLEEK
jgi:thiol-disulfide isomerase/thioredoxin